MEMDMIKLTEESKRRDKDIQAREQLEGTKIGVEIAKTRHQIDNAKNKKE